MVRESVICVLDKEFPPDHSFVRGMLCQSYPDASGATVILLVSRGTAQRRVSRIGRAICLPLLFKRRGVGRVANLFVCLIVLLRLFRRFSGRRRVLVRNDPVCLLASLLVRPLASRTVFQSSYPHEESHPRWTHRVISQLLHRLCIPLVDAVLVVAPTSIQRIRKYSPTVPVHVIPLLNDGVTQPNGNQTLPTPNRNLPLRILYLGGHAAGRKLEIVYDACRRAAERGVLLEMRSVGASEDDIRRLMSIPCVQDGVREGVIKIFPHRPRHELRELLQWATIGVSAVPPTAAYREMSPTKLAEYLAAGVPVLASRGIPLQEQWVAESGAGVLVDFSEEGLADGIEHFWKNRDKLNQFCENARAFAQQRLQYDSYVGVMHQALGSTPSKESDQRALGKRLPSGTETQTDHSRYAA